MTVSAGAEYSAPIMEALGRPGAAAGLRWRQESPDLAAEIEELTKQIEELEDQSDELQSVLCKRCAARPEANR